jgi:hypothetical protein
MYLSKMLTSTAPSAVLADQPCDGALYPCMSMSVALPRLDVLTCYGTRQCKLMPAAWSVCLRIRNLSVFTQCRSIPVQKHLEKVYATLAAALVVAAFGAYVQILLGWSAGLFGVIGAVICMTGLTLTQSTAYNINRRCAQPTLSACPSCAEVSNHLLK